MRKLIGYAAAAFVFYLIAFQSETAGKIFSFIVALVTGFFTGVGKMLEGVF